MYFRQVVAEFGLEGKAALLLAGTQQTFGLTYEELLSIAARADVLVNISGMLTDEAILERIPVRAYLDLDPAFNQWWHSQGIAMHFAGHTHFITIGQSPGAARLPRADLRTDVDPDLSARRALSLAGGRQGPSRCLHHRGQLAELWLRGGRRRVLWPKSP